MKQYLDKIEEIIDKEINTYTEMENLLKEKTNIIMKNSIDDLEIVDTKIIEYTTDLTKLVKARQNQCIYVERIDLTINEVIEKAMGIDKSQGERLQEKKHKLEKIISKIKEQNNINAKLIKNTLVIMNKTLDFIFKIIAPELDMYNQKGQINKLNSNYRICSIEQEV